MQRHYYDRGEPAEREPLDNPYNSPHNYHNPPQGQGFQQQQAYGNQGQYPPPSRGNRFGPGAHPDSSFNRMQQENRQSREYPPAAPEHHGYYAPQQPPPRRDADRHWAPGGGYAPGPQSNITPGADNFGEGAAGGITGIAYSVAEKNARESGLEAMRGAQGPPHGQYYNHGMPHQGQQMYTQPYDRDIATPERAAFAGGYLDRDSHSSSAALGASAASLGRRSPSRSPGRGADPYVDDPLQVYARPGDPRLGSINPNDIADDGDEGLEYRRPARTSMISLHSNRSGRNGAGAAAGVAAAGGVAGAVGGIAARSGGDGSGQYNAVNNGASSAYQGSGRGDPDFGGTLGEKSEWLSKQNSGKKKWKWIIAVIVVLVIAGGIAGGVVGGVVLKKGGGGGQSAADDAASNGDLGIDSKEIKGLLNNKKLHKVFPGMDYTPYNTQYPECLQYPPSQNNITRDLAVLTQLTDTIRLYGTDCNQTEMVLHSIDRLKMKGKVKVWMGVWRDDNATTNSRQLEQMYNIFDNYGADPFAGVIVANEILFRQQMTSSALGLLLSEVRTNLSSKGINLPVATSDLGDAWTNELALQSDYIMANIHPFFAGVPAADATSWSWTFWENKNGPMWKSDKSKNVISEFGWPSGGGKNCPFDNPGCSAGSVSGIDGMNQVLDSWVCQALSNGTNYFWFEAFDEPWKVRFNVAGKEWEDKWGLFNLDRTLKDGVKIPDCGGKTVG